MMVYCHNCGTKNEEEDEYCSKCGTPLKEVDKKTYRRERRRRRRDECFGVSNENRQRQREECFGLPHGNIIVALIIGVILILAGLSSIYRIELENFGPALIVLIGLLIIAGAIYGARRKN
jgi:uncharacterized membrane protein YvbJ